MKSLITGLVIILIFRGSSAGILSSISSNVANFAIEKVSSISSLFNGENKYDVSDFTDSLSFENGGLDLSGAIKLLQKNVDLVSIFSSVNVSLPLDGRLDLKSALQDFSLEKFDFTSVLSSLNLNVSDAVQDFLNLIKKIISSLDITEYLKSLTVNTTEDGKLDFKGLAEKYARTAEEYYVTTEDGFILKLFRIPGDGDVVLLSHAFLTSSDDFIIRGNTSLIYMLLEKGYDVWVMNYRGNRYSRTHTKLNPDTDAKFWDYSMHEFGYYDLSAVIDFVLENTGEKNLSVIGHSEGNAAVFVLTSTRPEYNDKIKVFVALSPVCYLSNSGLALKALVTAGPVLNEILLATGVEETLGFESFTRNLIQLLCSQGTLGYSLCVKVGLAAIGGYHPENLEQTFFQTVLGHFPAGSSRKNFKHYTQIGNSGIFRQYDYGTSGNIEKYGSATPPEYDFSKVTCKVVLFAGENDLTLGIKDAERVRDQVPNLGGYYVVQDKQFNHADFIWGVNAYKVLYPKVLAQFE